MAEQYANVTVFYGMHGDRRFDLLAELGGWSRPEACWRMVELWSRCTALQTDQPPPGVIRVHLGLRGEQLLVDAVLGERQADGSVRVLGGGLSGGDTDRFGWYTPVREVAAANGRKRAATAVRGPRGQFLAGTARSSAGPADDQRITSAHPAGSSGSPGVAAGSPASGFRIPDLEDQNSLSRAIPPAVPGPESTPVPAASPPAPAREDIAGAQPTAAGVQQAASKPAQVTATTGDRGVQQPAPFDPTDPFSRGRLAEATWRRISDAAIAIAAELKLPAPLPFPAITPGSMRAGFRDLLERIREEGELAPTVCDRVVENLVSQARAKRSVEWLAEKVFGERAWLNARNGIDPSARSRSVRSAGTPPSAPPREQPKPRLPDPVRTAAELAELSALADRLVENPDAAAAAELERGRIPAHMPTAELVKRFGDGQRAPPRSAGPDDDTPDEKPRRKAAK